jgi:Tfp pilus assembly protein PilF
MSIILDALRRGRAREVPRVNPHAAQTDAVLQTLGYGRFNPTSPLNRLKRFIGYLALAVVFALLLWGAVVWVTQFLLTPSKAEIDSAPQSTRPAPPPVAAVRAPVPAPSPAPAVRSVPVDVPGGPPAVAPGPVSSVARPVPAPLRPAPPLATGGALIPSANQPVVQSSRRVVPDVVPTAPTGAPSRTAFSTAAATTTATVTTGEDHFGRAMMYQRLGDFENALVSYRQVLQRDDLNVEAHNNLGVLYRDKGLLEDAVVHFQRAIAINPNYARACNNLGVTYLGQRKFDAAAAQFHRALAIDPKNIESMVNLSIVEKESRRRDEARGWLSRALEIEPRNAEAQYNLGLLEDEAGNATKALAHYRAFLQSGAATHPSLAGEVRKRIELLEGKF